MTITPDSAAGVPLHRGSAMYVVVLKPVQGTDRIYQRGEVIDAGTWRLTEQLLRLRYVREATPEELASGSAKRGKKHAESTQ